MKRQHVHLSATTGLAAVVGRRRDPEPAILTVAAREAHDAGVAFHDAGNGVWLDRIALRWNRERFHLSA